MDKNSNVCLSASNHRSRVQWEYQEGPCDRRTIKTARVWAHLCTKGHCHRCEHYVSFGVRWTLKLTVEVKIQGMEHEFPHATSLLYNTRREMLQMIRKTVVLTEVVMKNSVYIYHLSHACYIPHRPHPALFDGPKTSPWMIVIQSSPLCSFLLFYILQKRPSELHIF